MAKKYESTFTNEEKKHYMQEALKLAQEASDLGEVPIGCVIVQDKKILATGYNLRESSQDATTHAEMNAIRQANHLKKSFRLENTAMFVTIEPCVMCAGAILLTRIPEVYFGNFNPKGGAFGSVLDVSNVKALNHSPYLEGGILMKECGEIMTAFFTDKRTKMKENEKDCF